MEKSLGELFDQYSLLYIKYKDTENQQLIPYLNKYKEIISRRITYLADNLELNILVNYLIRANKEYWDSLKNIESYQNELIEESELLASNAVSLSNAIRVKEKYIEKVNDFMRDNSGI